VFIFFKHAPKLLGPAIRNSVFPGNTETLAVSASFTRSQLIKLTDLSFVYWRTNANSASATLHVTEGRQVSSHFYLKGYFGITISTRGHSWKHSTDALFCSTF